MRRILTAVVSTATLAFTSHVALATDFIVDRSNGPGTDFVSIQAAIFAADHGDRIFVRAGAYEPFVVRKGLHVQALGAVSVAGPAQVLAVPAQHDVLIAGFTLGSLLVRTPSRVAIVDCEVLNELNITNSDDVRLHRVVTDHPDEQTTILGSLFEMSDCRMEGRDGVDEVWYCDPEHGHHGVLVTEDAHGRVARCSMDGGKGGDGDTSSCFSTCQDYQALGGAGLYVFQAGAAVSGRAADFYLGGSPGLAPACFFNSRRRGIVVYAGRLRVSGVTSYLGLDLWNTTVIAPNFPDVSLGIDGDPVPGGTVILEVDGDPGAVAELVVGRTTVPLQLDGGVQLDLNRPSIAGGRLVTLPPLDAAGSLQIPLTIPASYDTGTLLWLQVRSADATSPGNDLYSNSVPLLVR